MLSLAAGLQADEGSSRSKHPQQPAQDLQAVAAKAHELEAVPLSDDAKARRTQLFDWFVQSPDVTVNWCAAILLDAPRRDKEMAGGLLVQAMLSAGAFVIEHPESSTDKLLVSRAGLHGALLAYQVTVAAEPKRASRFFDDLVALDSQGKLDDYLKPKMASCK